MKLHIASIATDINTLCTNYCNVFIKYLIFSFDMQLTFREIAKPLLPLGKAGKLVVEILKRFCKEVVWLTTIVVWANSVFMQ